MKIDPEQVVRNYYQAYEACDVDAALSFMTDDVVYEDLALEFRCHDKAVVRKAWMRYFDVAKNEDHRATLHAVNVLPTGEYFIEWTERTRLNRDWGVVKATGVPWEVRGASVGKVADGLIVENRDYYSLATILRHV